MMVHFRKRFFDEDLKRFNNLVVQRCKAMLIEAVMNAADGDDSGHHGPDADDQLSLDDLVKPADWPEGMNWGTLSIDASCTPAGITQPTDLKLLNEARETMDRVIDDLCRQRSGFGTYLPRYDRGKARAHFLSVTKKKKPRRCRLRAAVRRQLSYLQSNLEAIDSLIAAEASLSVLKTHWWHKLLACSELDRQQRILIISEIRSIPHRLVNLVQRYVRPIVRGQARTAVEFGAKISVSVQNGFPFLHRISWDAYNEGDDLIAQAERYKQDNVCYLQRIYADRLHINAENRYYCTRHGICLSCKRLGRPPKDLQIHAAHKQQLSADWRRRNEVKEVFGYGKRKYSLDLITARLTREAETSITMAFLVMCAVKILRLFRLFFDLTLSWFYRLLRLCGPWAMSSTGVGSSARDLAMLAQQKARPAYFLARDLRAALGCLPIFRSP